MNDEFRDLLHTHSTCPFCGHQVDDVVLSGLNCSVCRPCYESITYWSPSYAKIFTEDGVFEVWDYLPVAETWRTGECANAIFLEPQAAVADLSESTQRTIVAFTKGRYREALERIHLDKVNTETIPLQVPKPIIIAGNWVYARDVEGAKRSDEEQRTQATLSEAV